MFAPVQFGKEFSAGAGHVGERASVDAQDARIRVINKRQGCSFRFSGLGWRVRAWAYRVASLRLCDVSDQHLDPAFDASDSSVLNALKSVSGLLTAVAGHTFVPFMFHRSLSRRNANLPGNGTMYDRSVDN